MKNLNLSALKPFENKIWLSTPTMHREEMVYMQRAYDTNWMSTLGENIDEIEKSIAAKVGCAHAVALSCGTSAIHMAAKLADVKSGDKVFCSDMTFAATVNPIVYSGAEPIFIDTEYDTWNMDPKSLEMAIEKHPDVKVIVVADLYGTPAKFDEICALCQKHGLTLIEDAAESFGATYGGKASGTFGKYNIISFNGNKIITGSSGGMLLTDDKAAAEKARKWSTQSRDDAPWYQHTELGYNYRMSNVIAGVVRGQLPYLDEHIDNKRRIFERYKEGLSGLPITMNPYEKDKSVPNFWLSCLLIDEAAMCKQNDYMDYTSEKGKTCPYEILSALAKYNIESRPIWKPMHMQPIYEKCGFVSANENGDAGRDIFTRGLCLPSDIKMTEKEQDTVIEIIRACFE